MKNCSNQIKILLTLFITLSHFSISAQKIRYELSCPNAVHHEAEINLTTSNIPSKTAIFKMSRSSPGRYATHEFGKNVYNVKAVDDKDNPLIVNRIEGDVYEVPNHKGYIKLSYTLYGNYADGTYASVDGTNLHLNMPAVFMWLKDADNAPIEIQFNLPKDKNWKIATQLKPTTDPSVFTASGKQYFMDSPTKIGDLHIKEWTIQNSDNKNYTFRLVLDAHTTDSTFGILSQNVQRIVHEAKSVFGEFPAYDNGTYTFLSSINPYVQGDGMEHRNSTMITLPNETVPTGGWDIDVFAHEFFHCWNVERIRPKTLEPFNFEKSNMSNELWFAEGFTQYYGQLLMVRSGLVPDSNYAQVLDNAVYTKLNTMGCKAYSPIDASRHAVFVDAGVAVDKNNYLNMFTSYYSYGAAIALALDLELRTQFKSSLDDYMKTMWQKHGKTETPYTVQDLETALALLTKNAQFANSFFEKYIRGHEPVDYARLLAPAGYSVKKEKPNKAWMGGRFEDTDKGVIIQLNTMVGVPIYDAGLDIGDIITQLDGKNITRQDEIYAIIEIHAPNDMIPIVFNHRGIKTQASVKLVEHPYYSVIPYEKDGLRITPEIVKFRKDWLGTKVK